MKKIYKLIIFLVVFEFSVIIVNATGVFPNTLYSDVETEDLRSVENPVDILPYLFTIAAPTTKKINTSIANVNCD